MKSSEENISEYGFTPEELIDKHIESILDKLEKCSDNLRILKYLGADLGRIITSIDEFKHKILY
jgi:hypothetical protein